MSSGHQHSPSPPTEGLSASPPRLHSSAGDIPRPKRIACVVCRKRKLRCDGSKPSCGTCSRLGHDCAYDEIRRKSGPKRGYVKALEARLAQVETLLKHQDGPSNANTEPHATDPSIFIVTNGKEAMRRAQERAERAQSQHHSESQNSIPVNYTNEANFPMDGLLDSQAGGELNIDNIALGWDMMSLGVEEALPAQDVQDALTALFFDKVYPTVPMIHKGRYLMSLGLPPSMKPPIALRYAIWTLAASVSDEYFSLQTHFYRMARKYAEDQELKGHGEHIISTSTSQTWTLIATYEFKLMYFPRAWLSTGRAVRLAQMMGLHRLDGVGLDVKQCLQPPKDWTEREERRRTFWLAFCVDRYASIGTGWPMTIEEKDIMTNLPASEDAFERGRPAKSLTLKEAMTADGAKYLSPFGGVVLMACLFGRNLIHLHRPDADDRDDDLSGEFWRRHRHMDNILLGIALSLPSHFKLPMGINDSNIVFTNMNIHTSTICLHQAAIFKAEKNNMPASVSTDSKVRCITAAAEIASIMRMIAHLDLSGMNPFLSFCLYVAARVFVQYLKSRPNDEQVRASLQFLLTAMGHIKKKNPLTESFLVQLDVDLAGMLVEGNEQVRFNRTLVSMSGSNKLISHMLFRHHQTTTMASLCAQ
ncbi:fungal-specific transcription factor domain-containing protein [Peziza echinospora]|nr:fungal-specific transcription factor domain-containing protein [Peziza echinospora]